MERSDDSSTAMLFIASEILRILGTIGKGGRAVWPVALLLARFPGVERDAVLDAAAELEHEGRICTWAEARHGPAVILSPLEAWRQGLELDDLSRTWQRRRVDRAKRPIRIRRTVVELPAQVEDRKTRLPEDGPLPTILLGERLMWTGPDAMHGRKYQALTMCYLVCVGCGDAKKSRERYCLCCDNRPPKSRKGR